MKTIKKLIMAVTVSLVLCIIFGLTAAAEETVLYENDFSESGGWVWEDTSSASNGFGSDGAYVSACSGKAPKLVARSGDVKLNFTFDVGKTYEISFLTYTASAAEHRLNFNTGSNSVYIRTEDGRQAVLGENNNSSVAWWADDICNIGQLQSGKTPCWQNVSMRFTVSKIVGGSGDEVANTAVQWMTFSIPWSNESEIKIKDFSIKRIEGIKTEKTIVNSDNAVIGQTPSRAQTVFSKTNIGSVSGFVGGGELQGPKMAYGFVQMNAKTGSFVDVPSNGFTMKKGRAYRLNYFIKRGSGVSEAEISNEFVTSDGTVIVFEESSAVSLSSTGTPNSVWDNGNKYFTVKDIQSGNKSLDSASVDYIRFKFESVTGGTEFYFSDVTVSEFSNFVTLTKNVAEGGNIEINGSTDESVEIGQYSDIAVKITPAEGKRIKSAYMGDTDIKALVGDSVKGGTVNLAGIGKDSRLNVEFENAAADVPGFSGNVSVIKTDEYEYKSYKGLSYVGYSKLNDYEYAENCEYGFEITDPVSGNVLALKSAEKAASEQSFGIRIIGAALAGDSNYKFRPYVIVENKAHYGNAAYVIEEE